MQQFMRDKIKEQRGEKKGRVQKVSETAKRSKY